MPYENIKCQDHSTTKQQLLKSGGEKTTNWSFYTELWVGTEIFKSYVQASSHYK